MGREAVSTASQKYGTSNVETWPDGAACRCFERIETFGLGIKESHSEGDAVLSRSIRNRKKEYRSIQRKAERKDLETFGVVP